MMLYCCDLCGVQIESDEPLAKCKCGGTLHAQVYPQIGDVDQAIQNLRDAGLDAWDQIEDPEAFIREMRGD
jgi:hypothetical protein